MGLKLNLGCGSELLHGYLNIDQGVRKRKGYKVLDANILELNDHVVDNSVSEIRLRYVLEHIEFDMVPRFLWSMWKSLRLGGRLWILVPSIDSIYEKLVKNIKTREDFRIANLELFGDTVDTVHRSFFTESMLCDILTSEGFFEIMSVIRNVGTRGCGMVVIAKKLPVVEG